MTTDFQTITLGEGKDTALVSYGDRISNFINKGIPVRMPANIERNAEPWGHTWSNTVPVEFITDEQRLPPEFFKNIPYGGRSPSQPTPT